MFAAVRLPRMPGLAEALPRPAPGCSTSAPAWARSPPPSPRCVPASVVRIDVLPRVLALAAGLVAASPAADRVQLREQDVAGLAAVVRALEPGGWLMVGHAPSRPAGRTI
jgi:hypothetical protein